MFVWQARTHSQGPAFDLVIRGGRLLDTTGKPWFVADVGVKGDSIAAVPGIWRMPIVDRASSAGQR